MEHFFGHPNHKLGGKRFYRGPTSWGKVELYDNNGDFVADPLQYIDDSA
jgi:hypothetical protein